MTIIGLSIFIAVVWVTLTTWIFIKGLPHWLRTQLHYLYLVRIPVIGGAILLFLPIVAKYIAPQFLQNIFVIEEKPQLIIVIVFATLSAMSVVSLIKSILVLFHEELNDSNSNSFRILRTGLNFILFLPIWISLAFNSIIRNEYPTIGWGSFIGGMIISLILLTFVLIYDWRNFLMDKFPVQMKETFSILGKLLQKMDELSQNWQKNNNFINKIFKVFFNLDLKGKRRFSFGFSAVIALIFYGLTIYLNWPKLDGSMILKDRFQAPSLLYVLLIIWLITLLIGLINFWLDDNRVKQYREPKDTSILYTFRVPVIIIIIIFYGLSYGIFGIDDYFKLHNSNIAVNYETDFKTAIGNRLCPEDFQKNKTCQKEQTLVVVAASGGGIQASGWMTQVLAGLQQEIGSEFTQDIGLISSVSGGSVGTMFYLDKFENGVLADSALDLDKTLQISKILKNSTNDWLDSVTWGLAFPDLLKPIFGLISKFNEESKYLDRGYSLEKDWQRTLKDSNTTLDDWYKKAIKGEIPIPVFNSTIVENGRRFLISPMKFLPGQMADYLSPTESNNQELAKKIKQSKAFDFRTLYNNCGESGDQICTLEVTTASRLSATFPYVSPSPRNDKDNIIKDATGNPFMQNYHIADGGYFDNSGTFTALEWLDELLAENAKTLNIKKVILLRIEAFPEDALKVQQQGSLGFVTTIKGPLDALNGVRNSTQIARNIQTRKLIKERWEDKGIEIKSFSIIFPETFTKINKKGESIETKYNQPLSWRLTLTQKRNLKQAWENDQTIKNTVNSIKEFWCEDNINTGKCNNLSYTIFN